MLPTFKEKRARTVTSAVLPRQQTNDALRWQHIHLRDDCKQYNRRSVHCWAPLSNSHERLLHCSGILSLARMCCSSTHPWYADWGRLYECILRALFAPNDPIISKTRSSCAIDYASQVKCAKDFEHAYVLGRGYVTTAALSADKIYLKHLPRKQRAWLPNGAAISCAFAVQYSVAAAAVRRERTTKWTKSSRGTFSALAPTSSTCLALRLCR